MEEMESWERRKNGTPVGSKDGRAAQDLEGERMDVFKKSCATSRYLPGGFSWRMLLGWVVA